MSYTRPVITETGCYLDNHRGHYITRDAIELAVSFGFIIGPFEQYAVSMYDSANEGHSAAEYPHEALSELCDEAVQWLNYGDNEGPERTWKGQNSPPVIPDGYTWAFEDGDFGLWKYDDDGEFVIDQ